MESKVLLAGYYGFDNSGDDAILKSMVEGLKNDKQVYKIKVLSNDPEATSREYGVESVNRFSLTSLISAMEATDIFVFGGGSLLQDVTSTRSLIYYLGLIRLAKFFGKKVFIFANGIGPIDNSWNRKITKDTLDQVDFITLRDQESLDFVKKLGVKNPNIEVTADPVFMLGPASEARVDQLLKLEDISLGPKTLAISLRDWPRSSDLNQVFASFCDWLQGRDLDILLVPMHYPYDLDYLRLVKDQTTNPRVHLLESKYQVEETIGVLSRCQVSMAMRLHGVIYSAVAQVPTIGLVYDPKVYGLAKELNIQEFIRVEDIGLDDLKDLYSTIEAKLWDRKSQISQASLRQRELAFKTLDYLRELV